MPRASNRAELERLDPELASLIQLLPGYDPWDQMPPDAYFDAEAARFHLDWIPEWVKFHKGPKAGQPFAMDDWQRCIVALLWGMREVDGSRRYSTAFL